MHRCEKEIGLLNETSDSSVKSNYHGLHKKNDLGGESAFCEIRQSY